MTAMHNWITSKTPTIIMSCDWRTKSTMDVESSHIEITPKFSIENGRDDGKKNKQLYRLTDGRQLAMIFLLN